MFPSSSQIKFWTFSGTTELNKLRVEANHKFVSTFGQNLSEEDKRQHLLTVEEEAKLRKHYEYVIFEFCQNFQPPMPKYVFGTTMHFYKRFYLHNSLMDYHPKYILYTCCYLACKVEEFNVSIIQFVANIRGLSDPEKMADILLSQELLLMQQLHYHLTVHNPFRPLEGLLIDIKTRCPEVTNEEQLRRGAESFLDKSFHSDVCLVFAPSQIALAALLSSGSKIGLSLDSYVANKLLAPGGKTNLIKTVEHIKKIRYMVKNTDQLNRDETRVLEQKLEHAQNPENNPTSEQYQQKLIEMLDDEEERQALKRQRKAEEERRKEMDLLGI